MLIGTQGKTWAIAKHTQTHTRHCHCNNTFQRRKNGEKAYEHHWFTPTFLWPLLQKGECWTEKTKWIRAGVKHGAHKGIICYTFITFYYHFTPSFLLLELNRLFLLQYCTFKVSIYKLPLLKMVAMCHVQYLNVFSYSHSYSDNVD